MAQSRALHPAPCFNTQPPEGGCLVSAATVCAVSRFQHTAARRRLHACGFSDQSTKDVFQHTAARRRLRRITVCSAGAAKFQHTAARRRLPCVDLTLETQQCFNTQPPEGGCFHGLLVSVQVAQFQHTAARRRLRPGARNRRGKPGGFNTQPPEGGCVCAV